MRGCARARCAAGRRLPAPSPSRPAASFRLVNGDDDETVLQFDVLLNAEGVAREADEALFQRALDLFVASVKAFERALEDEG